MQSLSQDTESQSQFIDLTDSEQTQGCVSYGEKGTKVVLLEEQIKRKRKAIRCREA